MSKHLLVLLVLLAVASSEICDVERDGRWIGAMPCSAPFPEMSKNADSVLFISKKLGHWDSAGVSKTQFIRLYDFLTDFTYSDHNLEAREEAWDYLRNNDMEGLKPADNIRRAKEIIIGMGCNINPSDMTRIAFLLANAFARSVPDSSHLDKIHLTERAFESSFYDIITRFLEGRNQPETDAQLLSNLMLVSKIPNDLYYHNYYHLTLFIYIRLADKCPKQASPLTYEIKAHPSDTLPSQCVPAIPEESIREEIETKDPKIGEKPPQDIPSTIDELEDKMENDLTVLMNTILQMQSHGATEEGWKWLLDVQSKFKTVVGIHRDNFRAKIAEDAKQLNSLIMIGDPIDEVFRRLRATATGKDDDPNLPDSVSYDDMVTAAQALVGEMGKELVCFSIIEKFATRAVKDLGEDKITQISPRDRHLLNCRRGKTVQESARKWWPAVLEYMRKDDMLKQ